MDSIGSICARAADLDHAALEMIDMYTIPEWLIHQSSTDPCNGILYSSDVR